MQKETTWIADDGSRLRFFIRGSQVVLEIDFGQHGVDIPLTAKEARQIAYRLRCLADEVRLNEWETNLNEREAK